MSIVRTLLVLVVAVVALVYAQHENQPVSENKMVDCLLQLDFHCAKLRALADVYGLIKTKSWEVLDGVKLKYSGDANSEAEAGRALKKEDWSNFMFKLTKDLSLTVELPGGSLRLARSEKPNELVNIAIQKNAEEGRGKEKRKAAMSLLVFGGLYAILITFGVIIAKFIAFKALLVAKVGLVLAALSGLSRLFNQRTNNNAGYSGGVDGIGNLEKTFADRLVYNTITGTPNRRSWVPQPMPIMPPPMPIARR